MEFNFNPDDRADIQLVDPEGNHRIPKTPGNPQGATRRGVGPDLSSYRPARKQLRGILSESYARYDYRHPAPSPKAELHGPEK